jgi:subtilase family serine protease
MFGVPFRDESGESHDSRWRQWAAVTTGGPCQESKPVSKRVLAALLGAGALAVTTVTAGVPGAVAASAGLTRVPGLHAQRVCAKPTTGHATCLSKVMVDRNGARPDASTPLASALSPTQLKAAYGLSGASGGGRTVAIVDAYGYPNLQRDLTTYRSYYGLPSCTTSNGCLRIINQSGGTSLPRTNVGWDQEQALDVDAVSAACADCKILVVQASSTSFADLGTAVVTAAKQAGVVAISNSYGGSDAPDSTYGTYYNHPGIAVTASTGDDGYQGGSYPASSSYVTAVGGTTLKMSGTSRVSETVWSGAGSGCSSYNAALAAAASFGTGCSKRAMADVSAAADPNYGGLSVYAPTSASQSTWSQYGGTSEASPIIASVYALSGNTAGYANAIPYAHPASLHDITSGSNGSCTTTQWCKARSGWDGPSGLGTPNGTGAF